MARIDKVVQVLRGKAGTAYAANGEPTGVRIGAGGSIFPANGGSADGLLIVNPIRGPYGTVVAAGDRVDVLIRGEVVEFGGTAGDRIFAGSNSGALSTTNTGTAVGTVMDGGQRLVVTM